MMHFSIIGCEWLNNVCFRPAQIKDIDDMWYCKKHYKELMKIRKRVNNEV